MRVSRKRAVAAGLSSGFPPVSDARARILVLGSLPGQKSLEMGQYYAQPYNGFWKIMDTLFGAGPAVPYPERLERLIAHRVAVWDVLAAGERPGSLDSSIVASSIVVNDFCEFFERHPDIALICFNGTKAAELYRRQVVPTLDARCAQIEARQLPSTSPANAGVPFAAKLARWSAALTSVDGSGALARRAVSDGRGVSRRGR
jgi:double-stranded uracil-DNA glycosylase